MVPLWWKIIKKILVLNLQKYCCNHTSFQQKSTDFFIFILCRNCTFQVPNLQSSRWLLLQNHFCSDITFSPKLDFLQNYFCSKVAFAQFQKVTSFLTTFPAFYCCNIHASHENYTIGGKYLRAKPRIVKNNWTTVWRLQCRWNRYR